MTNITRAVTLGESSDLLSSATSAVIAWSRDGQVVAEPCAFRFREGKYLVGVSAEMLSEGVEVSLLIDEGPWYFDLRGVRVRGPVARIATEGDSLNWFELKPAREVAWNYGTLRER